MSTEEPPASQSSGCVLDSVHLEQQRRLGGVAPRHGVEHTGERVHLHVPVSDLIGNELVAEHAGILNHSQ